MSRGTHGVFALAPSLVVASLYLAISACGLTADFSNIQGGSALDAGQNDARAPLGDASPTGDAEASAGGFCASRPAPAPKLCADFDEGQPVSAGWTLIDTSDGQNVGLDTVAFSAPSSYASTLLPVGSPGSARLQESLPLLATSVHIEFKLLVAPQSGSYELCVLHEDTPQGVTYGVFYELVDGKTYVRIRNLDASGNETLITHTLTPPTEWMRVNIDIDVGNPGNVIVKHDGVVVVNELGIPTSTPDRTKLYVELGFYSSAKADIKANFDDVVIDFP